MSYLIRNKAIVLGASAGVAIIALFVLMAAYLFAAFRSDAQAYIDPDDEPELPISVVTIHPEIDSQFIRSIREPAYVEAFNEADLYARVSGVVKYIEKDEGDSVADGEVLVEIDVPDLVAEVAQKDAMVKQARADEVSAESTVRVMEASVQSARNQIALREAERDYRLADLHRIEILYAKKVVYKDAVDEATKFHKAAEAGVEVARSDLSVSKAKLVAAEADLDVKESRVFVAEKEREKVQAQADYAKVRAKFNGQIVKRHRVNVGTFVQNATSGHTTPLLTIKQLDKVRIFAMVPAKAAPFINKKTQVVIRLEGMEFRTQITRFADSLDPAKGRDMRVEVVVHNPPDRDHQRSLCSGIGSLVSSVGAIQPGNVATMLATANHECLGKRGILKDGMYGEMELVLQKFERGYTVPASAVFGQGDRTYIFEVKGDKVQRIPVRVELEDGIRARISIVMRYPDPVRGRPGQYRDLTGQEEIVRSNQGELSEGQLVHAVPEQPASSHASAEARTKE